MLCRQEWLLPLSQVRVVQLSPIPLDKRGFQLFHCRDVGHCGSRNGENPDCTTLPKEGRAGRALDQERWRVPLLSCG